MSTYGCVLAPSPGSDGPGRGPRQRGAGGIRKQRFARQSMCSCHGASAAPRESAAPRKRSTFPCSHAAPWEKAMGQCPRVRKPSPSQPCRLLPVAARMHAVANVDARACAHALREKSPEQMASIAGTQCPGVFRRWACHRAHRRFDHDHASRFPARGFARTPAAAMETNGKGRPSQEGKWHTQRTRIHRWKPYGSSRQ